MRDIDVSLLDYAKWAQVDIMSLPMNKKERYIKLSRAICAYLEGGSLKDYCAKHKIARQTIWNAIKRCITLHPDGRLYGFRALIDHMHVRKCAYTERLLENKCKGERDSFRMLVDTYPKIFEQVDVMYLKIGTRLNLHEPRMPVKAILLELRKLLKAVGVGNSEYPFNVKGQGMRSLAKYLKKLHVKHFNRATSARDGEDAARKLHLNMNKQHDKPNPDPYQIVLADGHRLDAIFAVELETPEGAFVLKNLDRLWLFVIMDEASRAILGYHLSLEREYTQEDVMRAIRSALTPWKPKNLTVKGLEYAAGAGLPNGVFPELANAAWQEFRIDNAKSNLSIAVKDHLHEIVGCSINAGPVKMPERRSVIERFFRTLEECGLHRIPSTTGTGPKDIRRKNPEEKAIKHKILLSEMEEFLDVFIANYNVTPNTGKLWGRSPMEMIQNYLDKGGIINSINEDVLKKHDFMAIRVKRVIRGKAASGKAPHVTYNGVVYTNDILRKSPDLVGEKVTLVIDLEDLRQVRAFLVDGAEFGVLVAAGNWGKMPHDLRMRKAMNKAKWEGSLQYFERSDPAIAITKHWHEKIKGKKDGKIVAKLEKMRRAKENDDRKNEKQFTSINPLPIEVEDIFSTKAPKLIKTKVNKNVTKRGGFLI